MRLARLAVSVLSTPLPATTLWERLLVGIPFAAISVLFAYEWVAYTFGLAPTLSKIISFYITGSGPGHSFFYGLGVGVVFLILFLHFTGLLRWWRP